MKAISSHLSPSNDHLPTSASSVWLVHLSLRAVDCRPLLSRRPSGVCRAMASNRPYGYDQAYTHSNANFNESSAKLSTPYGSGDPYYSENTGFVTPNKPRRGTSKWLKIGIPVAILVIAGAVVGVVLALRKKPTSVNGTSSSSSGTGSDKADGANNNLGIFAVATDSQYMLPIYPATVSTVVSCCLVHAS